MLLGMRLRPRRAGRESTRSLLFPNKWTPNPFVAVVATNNAFKAQCAGSALISHYRTPRGTKLCDLCVSLVLVWHILASWHGHISPLT